MCIIDGNSGVFLICCSWLFACAKMQQIAPVDEHAVTSPQLPLPPSGTAGQHGNNSVRDSTNSSARCISVDTSVESGVLNLKTPLKAFHPQFDVKVSICKYINCTNDRNV